MTPPFRLSLPPERWREVFAAADHALELEGAERESFIARCQLEDPSLGAELKALLDSADDFSALDGPAAAFLEPMLAELPSSRDIPPEARIGPYRILDTIGQGGMGTVYLAERADDQYRKRVALKLLASRNMGDEHRIRRFLEERQMLAALEHAGIARLLDGGVTPEGLPWFAMEYVEGQPIDRYCHDGAVSVEERLDLFCRVCRPVQYAHQNLIVHRDLKPANILVTDDGTVKLLDFGIAKLLAEGSGDAADGGLTQTGERIMTPLYASPEQVRGDPVSTASDVYALGVLLYQILAGRHPYRLSTQRPHEVAVAILEQEPERPSVVNPRLRGDLDAIVLKALEKNPADRYGSVEQLEADVHRHLTGLPVAARPATQFYQAQKFLRRHRVGVAVATGITLVILGFTVITLVQSLRLRAQSERIAQESNRAQAALDHLGSVFRTSFPATGESRGATAREVLDSSSARVEDDFSTQSEIRARLLLEMGRAYQAMDLRDRSRGLLLKSVAIQRELPDDRIGLAASLHALGEVRMMDRDLAGADTLYLEALDLRRRYLGTKHQEVARTLNRLAVLRLAQGRLGEAERLSRDALEIDRHKNGVPLDLVQSLRTAGHSRLARSDYEQAVTLYSEALMLSRNALPEEHLDVAAVILDLAVAERGRGHRAAADSLLRYGLGLQRRAAAMAASQAAVDSVWLRVLAQPAPAPMPARRFDSQIVFLSDREGPDPIGNLGHVEIYIMNPDGSGQRRLTRSNGLVGGGVLSPDGSRMVYSERLNGRLELYLMDLKSGAATPVANLAASGLGARTATWSPDGKRLAFSSGGGIHVINFDGTGLVLLTSHAGRNTQPVWSPVGARIAFVSTREGKPDLYLMNEDGTGQRRLTVNAAVQPDAAWPLCPSWSPDGRKIAFTSDREGNREIYVIDPDGMGLTRLTNADAEDTCPSWSPDGGQIVFARRVLGHLQIFVMNADGSEPRRITELSSAVANFSPNWGRVPPGRN